MKKFLLLLVGVLFALSAKADYYLVGDAVGNWDSKSYAFTEPSKGVYDLQYVGTIEANKAFKINNGRWDTGVNIGPISSSDSDKKITTGESKAYLNENQNYGGFYLSETLTNPYFLLDTNNKTLTVYKSKPGSETAEVNGTYVYFDKSETNWTEIAVWAWNNEGNCNSNGNWPGDAIHSGKKDGGYYFWALPSGKSAPTSIIFNDNKQSGAAQTGTFEFENGAIYNVNGKQKDPSTQVIYFDANGTGWQSVKMSYRTAIENEFIQGVAVNGKVGVYKFVFATALPTSAWTVKFTDGTNTLTTKSDFSNYTNGYVYKANGTNIEQAATTIDGYTPVVVTPTTYTIYFDAVRSGGAAVSLAVDGETTVNKTTVEINNHNIYQYDFEVVAGTQATFTYNGIALNKFTPVSGQVYYYNGSALASEAYSGYTWAPATSDEYKDMEIAISGDFLSTPWAAPGTSDAAPRFKWQEGSTFTLDLTGYTFETSTSFKIFNVTGDLKGTHNNYGEGYGSNGNAVTPGKSYTLTRTDATNANLAVFDKVVNPQITLDASNWTITIKAKEVVTQYDYYIHGKILGDGGWTSYKMTAQADGTWTFTSDKFVPSQRFGIKRTNYGAGQDAQNAWIYNNGTVGETIIVGEEKGIPVSLGVQYSCVIENSSKDNGKNWGTDKNFSKGTTYTLVFDPDAKTIVFINPTAVNAEVSAEAVTIGNSKANNLTVNVSVANYYKGPAVTSYTLSNGSYSATSPDGNFTNVPYATDYTLTPGTGAAMPINIKMPTTTFEISQIEELVAHPETGKASLVVYFKAKCDWLYNLPQIVCTSGSETISGEVVWKSNAVGDGDYDFAFIANDVVAYDADLMQATANKTFYFVVTPVYPFAVVAPATPAPSKMRAPASAFQYLTGAAVAGKTVEITLTSGVSGIEGLVIEAEDAPVEYFNLQGQRVDGDLAPGIYIRRQGATVTKVRI